MLVNFLFVLKDLTSSNLVFLIWNRGKPTIEMVNEVESGLLSSTSFRLLQ